METKKTRIQLDRRRRPQTDTDKNLKLTAKTVSPQRHREHRENQPGSLKTRIGLTTKWTSTNKLVHLLLRMGPLPMLFAFGSPERDPPEAGKL